MTNSITTTNMPEHEHNGERPDVKIEWWERLQNERKKFVTKEAFEYIGMESFSPDKDCVCCIDERVASRDTLGGEEVDGRWFVAGSGILLPVENWQERAKVAAEEAFKRGIKKFSYHAGCGAAKIAVEKDAKQLANVERYLQDPSLHAKQFCNMAQKELNRLGGQEEEVIFVAKDEVVPTEFHNAIGAVVDVTSEFNPHTLKDGEPLKHCFMLDWKSGLDILVEPQSLGYNLVELQTAINIAFDHGFGDNFDEKNKFNIVIMAHDKEELKAVEEKIKLFISSNLSSIKDRLEVVAYLRTKKD